MRIGMNSADTGHYTKVRSDAAKADGSNQITANCSFLQQLEEAEKNREPISNIRTAPKVPYSYLAKDGMITYNGVQFTCDEKTNSICLGDMTDKKQVINVPLSGGGHLKVNRKNLGQLSKAIGMFSPEDVNLIMRAIHLDTKVQSMQKEMEDLEASVGEQIGSGDSSDDVDDKTVES